MTLGRIDVKLFVFSNLDLFYTIHRPKTEAVKATLLIVHGMMEHSGRYLHFVDHLTSFGIAVLTFDHPGHGRSVKNETELGFFAKKQPVRLLVEHTSKIAGILEENYPNVPHFIFGHSMGSFITRCLLQIEPERFEGAIITGTSGIMPIANVGRFLLKVLNCIAPRNRSMLVNRSFSWMHNRHFRHEPTDHGINWLSVDIENRKRYRDDPLCGVDFTNNGFYTLLSLIACATKKNWHESIAKDFPLFLVSGALDPVGNFGKGVQQTYDDLLKSGFRYVEMKLYPNMRHEILNERENALVYEDILHWMVQVGLQNSST